MGWKAGDDKRGHGLLDGYELNEALTIPEFAGSLIYRKIEQWTHDFKSIKNTRKSWGAQILMWLFLFSADHTSYFLTYLRILSKERLIYMSDEAVNQVLHDGVTRKEWWDELTPHDPHNRRHLFAMWSVFGTPATMLDVGCGTGKMVQASRLLGVDAFGVDQMVYFGETSPYSEGVFFNHDLREPFSLGFATLAHAELCDWVISFETAEHIPAEVSGIFCDTLAGHVKKGGLLFFSAAHPGQGGIEHAYERPATYWRDMFYERGLNYRKDLTTQLIVAWNNLDSPLTWLSANIQVFEK